MNPNATITLPFSTYFAINLASGPLRFVAEMSETHPTETAKVIDLVRQVFPGMPMPTDNSVEAFRTWCRDAMAAHPANSPRRKHDGIGFTVSRGAAERFLFLLQGIYEDMSMDARVGRDAIVVFLLFVGMFAKAIGRDDHAENILKAIEILGGDPAEYQVYTLREQDWNGKAVPDNGTQEINASMN